MKKLILIIFGIIAAIYGIFILQVGSGTKFWLIWEAIAVFFFLWAFLLYKNFFETHKIIRRIFQLLLTAGVIILITFVGLIAGKFASKGEQGLDYIIVLGAQVRENGPSTILRYRLDEAIDYLNENPNTICIVSGGQGVNEPFSEAEGMAKYLAQNGIEKERILLESKSTNTVENIRNSKGLMDESYNGVGIVTNNFHVFRAVQIAKMQGLENVSGIAAYSHAFYLPNNVLRECCGILKDWLLNNI